ncbi:MAG: polysaccharide deacetylase family protein [Planctomycetaceae bacterium]
MGLVTNTDWNRPHWRVLYYHGVEPDQRDRFREQLEWFSERFRWCSLDEGLRALTTGPLTTPLMSVTFDDAEESVFRVALPVLQSLAIPACTYVVPAYVLQGTSFRAPQPRRTMTWNQLGEWLAAGHEVGSHTCLHVDLSRCHPDRVRQELQWSREEIEQALQIEVRHFAYPYGQYSGATQRLAAACGGYQSVATTRRGRMLAGHNPLALRRDRVELLQSPQDVARLMRLADKYYWLRRLRWRSLRQAVGRWRPPVWPPLPDRDYGDDVLAANRPASMSGFVGEKS